MVDNITPNEIEQEFTSRADREFRDRFKRMDDDFALWDMRELSYEAGPTAINITSNAPRTFADAVQTKLSAAERQIIVTLLEEEGEDKRDDVAKLERLFSFCLEQADLRLGRMLMPRLRDYIIWSALIRGWAAARILNYKLGGNTVFDYTPLDPRWLVYEIGSDGLVMANYKTFRSRTDLETTYNGFSPSEALTTEATKGRGLKDSFPVYEWWYGKPGKISYAVVCAGEFLLRKFSQALPSMPVIVMPVSTRPLVFDATESKTERFGDSIFAPNRGLFKLQNQLTSMWLTHAKLLYEQPLFNYFKPGGVTGIKDTIMRPEMVIDIPEETNRIEGSPVKEISPTLVNALNLVNSWIEQGSMPVLELTRPPTSGTALGIIEEARDKVFGPHIRLLNQFYTNICYLIEEQLLYGKISVNVKSEIESKYYQVKVTPIDLRESHIIRVEHTAVTPWKQLELYQIADMAKRQGLPDQFIWEEILKLQDPKGLSDYAAVELFEHSPLGLRLKAIKKLIEMGRNDEAMGLMQELYTERQQGEAQGGQAQPTQSPEGKIAPESPEFGGQV